MFDGPLQLDLDPAERRARLRLARSPRIGPITFHEALQHFGSARAACATLATVSDAVIAQEEKTLAAAGGRFLVLGDPAYPSSLAALADAPPVLSAIGDPGLPARPTLALVGAREASMAGRRFAGELAATLGAAGFVIASGLARGTDTAAHEAALATGTIAVLAGGIDQIYPPQNASLYSRIAAQGLLLSESSHGAPSIARAFPPPQPHRVGTVGRGDRDRSGCPFGLPDHGAKGRRTGSRGLCGARFTHGPPPCRLQ